jgi:sporulation protein YlmC with PRC-barrel domain/ribosomal protein L40E
MSSPKFFGKEEVEGKTVIETNGNRLGKAKGVAFSLEGATMLFVEKDDGTENQIPMSKVMAIAEFIVVRTEGVTSEPRPPQSGPAPAPASITPPSLPTTVPEPPHAPVTPSPPQATVPAPPPKARVCRLCGDKLKPGAKFCSRCGASNPV